MTCIAFVLPRNINASAYTGDIMGNKIARMVKFRRAAFVTPYLAQLVLTLGSGPSIANIAAYFFLFIVKVSTTHLDRALELVQDSFTTCDEHFLIADPVCTHRELKS